PHFFPRLWQLLVTHLRCDTRMAWHVGIWQQRSSPRQSNAASSVRQQRCFHRHSKALPARVSDYRHDTECHLAETKKELDRLLQNLGFPQTVLPGELKAKAEIDKVLHRLEALNPNPNPLQADIEQRPTGDLSGISPLLLGEWELLYASNGTVVTRTAPAQWLLLSASKLPGMGLSDIEQVLSLSPGDGSLTASNSAVFGLGPLGSWRVGIQGVWRSAGDGRTARVLFDQMSVKPVAALGLPAPSWLPPLKLAAGGSAGGGGGRLGADWVTSFLDGELRIGRGRSGNTFLFRRKTPR
ncbi:hypothetical protein Agub_g8513, partial [Astrephomene gubernaculifera]